MIVNAHDTTGALIDVRHVMDVGETVARTDLSRCTFCHAPGVVVTRHTWSTRPLGHLITRCTDHHARHN